MLVIWFLAWVGIAPKTSRIKRSHYRNQETTTSLTLYLKKIGVGSHFSSGSESLLEGGMHSANRLPSGRRAEKVHRFQFAKRPGSSNQIHFFLHLFSLPPPSLLENLDPEISQ